MEFETLLTQIVELLQRQGRVSYGALKRRFNLDDAYLQDIKDELIDAQRVATDDDDKVLVWTGSSEAPSPESRAPSASQPAVPSLQSLASERRQITVLFCDLVGSTALSTQLDPEDYQTLVQTYHQTCAGVIRRHEGYVAQPLGDGVLVYFGYPTAHEDDARRAIRTGLEIIEAVRMIPLPQETRESRSLQVRIGVHTGLVVVGEIGGGERKELLALGETPNLAARIQSLAEPNTILMSAATQRLVDQQFESQPFGMHLFKGFTIPIAVYHVQSERQGISPLGGKETLTPLIGREQEVGLLLDRWEQTKEGRGQVILLSGEPGIGKSRLALTLKDHVTNDGSLLYETRCSPYHQHSALYPLIEGMQRTLLFTRQDTDEQKVAKLEQALTLYEMRDTLPLFTALLSLPTPEHYPPLNVTPQKQKERTFQALLQLMAAQAERQATVSVWEDLHWADPSSLEFLSVLIEQIPTTKLMLVLTFRPEFRPSWQPRSHLSQLVLNRLGKKQVEAMIEQAAGKQLPPDVIEQIRLKTDGVPLFVEEVTKSVMESVGAKHLSPLQLAVPATLQEALLARLDRLSTARQIAQLGATLGREFAHDLLQAVSPLNEADLHAALTKLVEAEILYQRGVGEQARYFFKHALIQDTAYQSLLKSTRGQYHQQIAHILEDRFPDLKANQPELLAHHYTEANLIEQAIPYWQQAGQKAIERSANAEAIRHLTWGLELLKTLPDTRERAQQELVMQVTLGNALLTTRGYAAPEVINVHARARELCLQVGDSPHLFPALWGAWSGHLLKAELQQARELGNQLLQLAEHEQDTALLLEAHYALGDTLFWLGELTQSRTHLEQAMSLYDPQHHRSQAILYGQEERGVTSLSYLAWTLWHLGYGDQAQAAIHEALALARKLAPPFTQAFVLGFAAWFSLFLRESSLTMKYAKAAIDLSTEQGFPDWLAWGAIFHGWSLTRQGQREEGIMQMQQGLNAYQANGTELARPQFLAWLAEAYGEVEKIDEGLDFLAEAFDAVQKTGEHFYEAELYRLKGELTLQQQSKVESEKWKVPSTQLLAPSTQSEAEECFLKAIEVAQKQQAKSWELHASTSLARLWQSQGKQAEAHKLLSKIYHWFTEGFDTKDLQEAKALLAELGKES